MPIVYRTDLPSAEHFARLFDTTGWNADYHLDPASLRRALDASWFALAAWDGDHLVGFGRIVSDGVLHAMIYDLIVSPSHQGAGIGSELLRRLVARCEEARIPDVQLFCAVGKRAFYEKRGFVARADNAPGMDLRRAAR